MGSFLQISVGLEVSTLIEKFPAAVFHLKRNPALIEISLFRNKGVTDFSVLDHHACGHRLPRRKTEGFAAKCAINCALPPTESSFSIAKRSMATASFRN